MHTLYKIYMLFKIKKNWTNYLFNKFIKYWNNQNINLKFKKLNYVIYESFMTLDNNYPSYLKFCELI